MFRGEGLTETRATSLGAPDRAWGGRLALAAAMSFVGSTVVASAAAARLDPFLAALIRFSTATPALLALCLVFKTRWPRLNAREWGVLALQSAAGSLGYTALLVAGLRHASAADASILTGLLPTLTALVAVVALGERPGARLLLAVVLATAGAALIALRQGEGGVEDGPDRLLGLALVLAAMFGESLFAVLNKAIKAPVEPLAVATIMSAIALALGLVPGLWALARDGAPAGAPLWAMTYYGLGPTVVGFSLWYWGAARVSGVEAAAYMAVAPLAALALSWALIGEPLSARHFAGMGLVLAAIALTVVRPRDAGR